MRLIDVDAKIIRIGQAIEFKRCEKPESEER